MNTAVNGFPGLSFSLLCFSLLWRRGKCLGQCAGCGQRAGADYLDSKRHHPYGFARQNRARRHSHSGREDR